MAWLTKQVDVRPSTKQIQQLLADNHADGVQNSGCTGSRLSHTKWDAHGTYKRVYQGSKEEVPHSIWILNCETVAYSSKYLI